MYRTSLISVLLALVLGALAQMPKDLVNKVTGRWGDQGDGTFRNPILRADYSDPDPLSVGNDYYMVASTFGDYPGVSILHSHENCYSLTERKGWLRLKAFKAVGKQKGFFGASGTLMQHAMPSDSTVITIRIDATHLSSDGHAGLAVFNGGKNYGLIDISDLPIRKGCLRVYINKEGVAPSPTARTASATPPTVSPHHLRPSSCYSHYSKADIE